MEILEGRLRDHASPRWTEAVREEILSHSDEDDCKAVLAAGFLGNPYSVPIDELAEVFRIRRALSAGENDPTRHLGEAESIWVADRSNGTLITDDYDAFEFAERRLGSNRVLDTVDILKEAVKVGDMSLSDAKQVVDAIRNSGRHLRAGHPPTITEEYLSE